MKRRDKNESCDTRVVSRRVIGIVRVSTPGQATEDKFGQARQRHDIEQTAKAHNLEIARMLEVVESGSSAFNGADFKQVFADLARPDIAGVVVSALDRLVRPGFLGDLQVFDHFQRNRKLIFSPGQVVDVESDAGWLVSGMFGLSSGLEKRMILKRTLGGKERARAAGKHPGGAQTLPRGLSFDKATGKWSYLEPDASKVKKCYDLLFAGMGFEDIAQAVGFRTGKGVGSILRNPVWMGIRRFQANSLRAVPLEKPLGIAPLISRERWQKAQKILDEKRTTRRARKRQEHTISLGLGLLRCRCGRFHYLRRDYRRGEHDLFYCASMRQGGCGAPSFRRSVADAAVIDAIATFGDVKVVRALVEQAMSKPAGKPRPAAKTQREIARVNADRERLIDMRVKNKISEEQFDARDRSLAGELRDLEALLPKPEAVIDPKILASLIAGLFAEFPFLTPEQQYKLARRVFVAFDVTDGGGVETAVIRGETLAQAYANFRRPSR